MTFFSSDMDADVASLRTRGMRWIVAIVIFMMCVGVAVIFVTRANDIKK